MVASAPAVTNPLASYVISDFLDPGVIASFFSTAPKLATVYCGIFNVVPLNVADPVVPIVVNVIGAW